MRRCAEFFCTYDDYNWDWSLQHVSQGCMTRKLQAVVMRGPRVFHIGEWYGCPPNYSSYFVEIVDVSNY
jgi:hypothetical protein